MSTIYAEYNMYHNSIDIYTSAGYMLRIDCNKGRGWTENYPPPKKNSQCSLNALAIDEPLEYTRLYLDGAMQMWVDSEDLL